VYGAVVRQHHDHGGRDKANGELADYSEGGELGMSIINRFPGGGGGMKITLTVSVDSGATVTATKGTKTVQEVSSGGTAVLNMPEAGTWSVVATMNGQTSNTQTVSVPGNYSLSLKFVSTTLNNNTWAEIGEVSSAGQGANFWSVGDRKAVTLNGTVGSTGLFSNVSTYAFIIGFNHNQSVEGSGRIHFQLGKTALTGGIDVAFVDSKYANYVSATGYFSMHQTTATNVGWSGCQMRSLLGTSITSYSGTFIGALPSDLRNALKSVTKYTNNSGYNTTESAVTATTDYLFLLAEFELNGSRSMANQYEQNYQAQYAYYSAGNSKVKYRHNATSSSATYWTRSYAVTATSGMNFTLSAGNSRSTYCYGVAPAFCV
jgi:hypothetical protein